MRWTKEQSEQLRALVLSGVTAAHAARVMGLSRAAVIGKADRMGVAFGTGLSPEASERHQAMNHLHRSIDKVTGLPKSRKTNRPPRQTGNTPPAKRTAPEQANPDLAADLPPPIGVVESYPEDSATNPKTCRYVFGDTSKPGWQWCGHPTEGGRPYCIGHQRRFYTVAKTRPHNPTPRRRHASKGRYGVFT